MRLTRILDKRTNKSAVMISLKRAAEHFGLNYNSIKKYVNKTYKNRYEIKYLD